MSIAQLSMVGMKNDHTVIKRVRVSGAGSSVVNGDYVFVHRDVFLQLTLQHNYDWVNDGQTCSMGPLVWRRETDDESADDESAWICIKYDKSRWFIGLFLDEIEDYYMTEKIGDPFAPPFQGTWVPCPNPAGVSDIPGYDYDGGQEPAPFVVESKAGGKVKIDIRTTVVSRLRLSNAGSSDVNGEYEIVHRDEVIKLRPEAHVGHVGHAGHVGPLVWRRVRNRDEDKEHSSRWIWFDGSAWLIGDVRSGDSLYCVYDEFDLGVRHSLLPTIYEKWQVDDNGLGSGGLEPAPEVVELATKTLKPKDLIFVTRLRVSGASFAPINGDYLLTKVPNSTECVPLRANLLPLIWRLVRDKQYQDLCVLNDGGRWKICDPFKAHLNEVYYESENKICDPFKAPLDVVWIATKHLKQKVGFSNSALTVTQVDKEFRIQCALQLCRSFLQDRTAIVVKPQRKRRKLCERKRTFCEGVVHFFNKNRG